MLVLPIPLVVSLILLALLAWSVRTGQRHPLFVALLAASAVQGMIVALARHYGVEALRPVQPVTATLLPPLAWLAFQAGAVQPSGPWRGAVHLIGPAIALASVLWAPELLDLAVPGVFVVYGVALLMALRGGSDSLPRTSLAAGDLPRRAWGWIAVGLMLSALADGLTSLAFMVGAVWLGPVILSVSTTVTLGLVGAIAFSQAPAEEEGGGAPEPAGPVEQDLHSDSSPGPDLQVRDGAVMARLAALMTAQRLYLDPDLSLERLARRLGVPAKQVSGAVNRTTGDNVSRYVNGLRIAHACTLLRRGETVTSAMLGSGFNTKSNFNREFLRVTGQTPSGWTADEGQPAPGSEE